MDDCRIHRRQLLISKALIEMNIPGKGSLIPGERNSQRVLDLTKAY